MDLASVSAFTMYKVSKRQKSKDRNKKKTKNSTHQGSLFKGNIENVEEKVEKQISKKLKHSDRKNKHLKTKNKDVKIKRNRVHSAKKKDLRNEQDLSEKSAFVLESSLLSNRVPIHASNSSQNIETSSNVSEESFNFTPITTDSRERGLKAFEWLIAPYNSTMFFNKIWEKKPLHISRKTPSYYKDLISTPIIDVMLRKENILFTKNIDVTSYVNGIRETHNPVGRALPHVVWDYYLNSCSIRLLNPQTYIPKLHLLNSTLQELFNSFVGANAYLTPADSQGFAPHYDDIEAFVIQVEGKKHWRIYSPRSKNEILPRVSSQNFTQDEIGEPILEVTLEPGDLLYFPRGFIHQAVTVPQEHSLHLTISMYQKHSWADMFEKMIPLALQAAINNNVELRKGLPFDIYDNFGLVNSDSNTPRREETTKIIKSLFDNIKDYLPIDAAVDEMNKKYQHEALPPVLNDAEKAVTVYGDCDVMNKNGIVTQRVEIGPDTRIRLLRKNILRMVMEEDGIKLYYHTDNSLEYQGMELQYLEINEDLAPAIETLIELYPEYVSVENLNIDDEAGKVQVAKDLWERGLVMTEYPLENIDDD
ncbi:Bifunctional lysine-specific demethylase and histidyl-hydroxylase NO66 [Eumeta japonica]|uniref:Bifunctional lysine-specific demethylase and histidyl-hydroxylase n=1 Tax=Eumeta variegata TaxID=151549 RepID=A0A4C1YD12_EUMVA|nr:Bifunctional lysine-specific demethylase and histidyl-hydroxylase NO66 [Eumeta japonica]